MLEYYIITVVELKKEGKHGLVGYKQTDAHKKAISESIKTWWAKRKEEKTMEEEGKANGI